MRFKSNEDGRCPICNSESLEYFGMEFDVMGNVYYPWHCPDCDTDGKEWYYVNFSEVRSNDDHIGDVEGICPDCGAEIEYGTAEPEGNSLGYEYFCPECENSGTEWYDLDFDSHTIDGHEDEEIDIVKESKSVNDIETELKSKVAQYKKLKKVNKDDTSKSKDLEDEIEDLEAQLKKLKKEAIDYKNDKLTVTTAEDPKDDREYYGRNMTKRDKVRSLDQAKRNLDRMEKDPRVTQGQAIDQVSFDSALDTDLAYYKHNKDMAKIDKAQGNDFWADEHNKTAKQFADKIRDKHKKQEARNPENDEINAKIRSALFGSTKYNKDLEDAGFILDTYGPKNKVNSIHYKDNDKYLYRGKMYNSNKDTDYYNYLTKKSPITWSEETTNLSNAYGNVSSKKDVATNGEYFSNGWNTVVGKAMPKRFKTNKSSVMVTEPYGSETIKKYKKFNDTIASKKSDLQDNRNNLQNDIAEKQNNINNTQKEIDQLEKDKQDLIANKKAKSNQQNNINKKQEAIDDKDEEKLDINLEDTISLLDMALSEIPTVGVEDWGKDDELLFTADTKVMFKNLKHCEEEIPKYYYDNASNDDWSNGIDSYLEEIKGVNPNDGDGDNTYNWNAPLTHDVEFTIYEADDCCYFKGSIHRTGDVRGNYTTEFLLKFNDKDDCLETLFDTCSENCYRQVTVDDIKYTIEPHFFDEYVSVFDYENQESYDDVYCDCIERLREIIAENKDSEE